MAVIYVLSILHHKNKLYYYSPELAAYRYYQLKNTSSGRGKTSNKTKEAQKEELEKIKSKIERTDEAHYKKSLYDDLRDDEKYYLTPECQLRIAANQCNSQECKKCEKSILCSKDMYDEFVLEDFALEKMKKLYLINNAYPEVIDHFLENFQFEPDDEEIMRNMKITVTKMKI